jgi:hypothetical protein
LDNIGDAQAHIQKKVSRSLSGTLFKTLYVFYSLER